MGNVNGRLQGGFLLAEEVIRSFEPIEKLKGTIFKILWHGDIQLTLQRKKEKCIITGFSCRKDKTYLKGSKLKTLG